MEKLEVRENQQERINVIAFAYLAGIIDGEGTITVKESGKLKVKRAYHITPSVVIVNTSEDLINWIHLFLSEQMIGHYIHQKKERLNRRKIYRVIVKGSSRVLKLLEKVHEFLIIKKRQSEIIQELCKRKLVRDHIRTQSEVDSDRKVLEQIRMINRRLLSSETTRFQPVNGL